MKEPRKLIYYNCFSYDIEKAYFNIIRQDWLDKVCPLTKDEFLELLYLYNDNQKFELNKTIGKLSIKYPILRELWKRVEAYTDQFIKQVGLSEGDIILKVRDGLFVTKFVGDETQLDTYIYMQLRDRLKWFMFLIDDNGEPGTYIYKDSSGEVHIKGSIKTKLPWKDSSAPKKILSSILKSLNLGTNTTKDYLFDWLEELEFKLDKLDQELFLLLDKESNSSYYLTVSSKFPVVKANPKLVKFSSDLNPAYITDVFGSVIRSLYLTYLL